MKDVIKYKNFFGTVHYSTENEVFFGKIEGIKDLVTFEGKSVKEIKKSFMEAVEDYIELCQNNGIDPFKSFKGSFNVRIKPEIHKLAFQLATMKGQTLNQFVQEAISHEITKEKKQLEIGE